MSELIAMTSPHDDEPEKIDLSSPESIIFELFALNPAFIGPLTWHEATLDNACVLDGELGVTGAASYEEAYGCGLDYLIEDLIPFPGTGWWVIENVTADFHRGDGYTSDDDIRFSCGGIRPATAAEIAACS